MKYYNKNKIIKTLILANNCYGANILATKTNISKTI